MNDKPDFWVIVALDYGERDEAFILAESDDTHKYLDLDGYVVSDSIDWDTKGKEPGLYKLTLNPWSHQSYEGEWDCGIDVIRIESILMFPKLDGYKISDD